MLSMTSSQRTIRWILMGVSQCVVLISLTGCTAILQPINAIPAHRLPPQFLAEARADKQPIDFSRLRQVQPESYLLDTGDVLGIYIANILGKEEEAPPVHFPERNSDLPPAIGFPTPVRDDGTISLPLIEPLDVRGMTLAQLEQKIRYMYTQENKILKTGEERIIVTLIKERTIRVIVVRQDNPVLNDRVTGQFGRGGAVNDRSDRIGRGFVLQLPAYKNDLMQALAETGGLPGLNAKNEVKILRGNQADFESRDAFVQEFYRRYHQTGDPCFCPPPLPEDPAILRIPLRLAPGQIPSFRKEDIILNDGDILYVESRDTEVFYTGGLLPGGEHSIPRDYDLDVLGAIAIAGGNIGGQVGGLGGSLGRGIGGAPPSQLIVLRKTPCNGQIAIAVNLTRAINDPRTRLLVQPGDTLILRYTPEEEILNFALGTFFTFGVAELFQQIN